MERTKNSSRSHSISFPHIFNNAISLGIYLCDDSLDVIMFIDHIKYVFHLGVYMYLLECDAFTRVKETS